jgi:deazaflavin-dependent oxidoreductase (nitroreductase family)
MDSLELADRSWPVLHRLMGGHAFVYRATRGRIGTRIPGIEGRVMLLDHAGAKSGKKRTTPLLYVPDGDSVAVIASKGGFPKNPAWFYNLRANPETTIQIGPERRPVRARVAEGEERDRLFAEATKLYSGYAEYAARTERTIPVVVLEPR